MIHLITAETTTSSDIINVVIHNEHRKDPHSLQLSSFVTSIIIPVQPTWTPHIVRYIFL